MRFMQRAFLYVIRKKGKSVLLLVILLVIATFVLTGLSIERASTKAQDNLRQSLGGVFQVTPDFTEENPYFRMDSDGEGNTNLYTELPVTENIINAIMGIEGILSCNAESKCLISAKLDVFPGNVPLKPDYKDKVYARIVAGTENNNLFQSGTVKLKEGRHMTGNDNYAAVISSDLAQRNHLGIGDSISLQGDENAEVKIVGIFEILKPDSIIESITTYDRLENQIFTGLDTYERLIPGQAAGYLSAEFKVSDPARLDTVLSQVKNISTIDWRAFTITQDNETYLEAAAPLSELQSLVTALLMVIIIVSAVILTLILTMWGRTRIHETGVLLSFGIGKSEIISQYLAEVMLIAVFAFGLSYFTSLSLIHI